MEEIEDVVILSDDEDIQDVIEGDFKKVKLENDVPTIKLVPFEQLKSTSPVPNIAIKITNPRSIIPRPSSSSSSSSSTSIKPEAHEFRQQIYYKKTPTGQRIKVVPKRHSTGSVPSNSTFKQLDIKIEPPKAITPIILSPNSDTSGISSSMDSFMDLMSQEIQPPNTSPRQNTVVVTTPKPSPGGSKRKSQHITKPDEDILFEETLDVEDSENTELMEHLAYLRVSLNYLLGEVGLNEIEFGGAIGKTRPLEKVKQMIVKKKNEVAEQIIKEEVSIEPEIIQL